MKKLIFIFVAILTLTACNDNNKTLTTESATYTEATTAEITSGASDSEAKNTALEVDKKIWALFSSFYKKHINFLSSCESYNSNHITDYLALAKELKKEQQNYYNSLSDFDNSNTASYISSIKKFMSTTIYIEDNTIKALECLENKDITTFSQYMQNIENADASADELEDIINERIKFLQNAGFSKSEASRIYLESYSETLLVQ